MRTIFLVLALFGFQQIFSVFGYRPISQSKHSLNMADDKNMDNDENQPKMIDNSNLLYISLSLPCGVEVRARPGVLSNCPAILHELDQDLKECLALLPKSVHRLIKRTRIWINESYMFGPIDKPHKVNCGTTHHAEEWLNWVCDNPEKARSVELYDCYEYLRSRLHWNGCGLILHEFCHLIHNMVLPNGLDNKLVSDVYERTLSKGKYDKIIRRDWAGRNIDCDKAYAMVNRMEFFAEMSVTYLSYNYPELDEKEIKMSECSPPFLAPNIIEEFQNKYNNEKNSLNPSISKEDLIRLCGENADVMKEVADHADKKKILKICLETLSNLTTRRIKRNRSRRMPHCNKFYPFTRGQLKAYDPDLLDCLTDIWKLILDWEDEHADDVKCGFFSC